jgi:plasmid stability protein
MRSVDPAPARPAGGEGRPQRYRIGTIWAMAMTLRLTDDEHAALQDCAAAEGISMQDAARRAVREYVLRTAHRARVRAAADLLLVAQADVLRPREP